MHLLMWVFKRNYEKRHLTTSGYRLVGENHIECLDVRHMGKQGDGGWDICLSEPFTPAHNNCLVYSFGYGIVTSHATSRKGVDATQYYAHGLSSTLFWEMGLSHFF